MFRRQKSNRKLNRKTRSTLASQVQLLEQKTLPAGTVLVSLVGNNLTIIGDHNSNDINVDLNPDVGLTVSVDEGSSTKIRFNNQIFSNYVARGRTVTLISAEAIANDADDVIQLNSINIDLKGGNDDLDIDLSGGEGIVGFKLTGNLSVNMGSGSDDAIIEYDDINLEVVGNTTVTLGNGENEFELYDNDLDSILKLNALTITGGVGTDDIYLDVFNATIAGDVNITTSVGQDEVSLEFTGVSVLNKKLTISTGTDEDEISLNQDDNTPTGESNVGISEGFGLEIKGDVKIDTGADSDLISFNQDNGDENFEDSDGFRDVNSTVKMGASLTIAGGTGGSIFSNTFDFLEVVGALKVDGGDGADEFYFGNVFEGFSFFEFGFFDRFNEDAVLVVGGDTTITTGVDADIVSFLGDTVSLLGNVTINTGTGSDEVSFESEIVEIGNFQTETPVAKSLKINTDASPDYVSFDTELFATGSVEINTGNDADYVDIEFEEFFSEETFASSISEDVGNSILGSLRINTGADDDGDEVFIRFDMDYGIKGNLEIATGDGSDYVEVVGAEGVAVIRGDLKLDTGASSDMAALIAEDGDIIVKGNLDVKLGGDDDCFVAGSSDVILDNEFQDASFVVEKNTTVLGGAGDDAITLAGIETGTEMTNGNLTVSGEDGDDVIGGTGLKITGNLVVNGGKGNDLIGAGNSEFHSFTVDGTTTVDAGEGNDTVLVRSVTFNGNINVQLQAGNDNLAAVDLTIGEDVSSVVLNGGAGTNLKATDELTGATVTNFSADPYENAEADGDLLADILFDCINHFDFFDR